MIDNLSLIKPLLSFKEEGDFYMAHILIRKKDQPEGEKDNKQSVRLIKTYYFDSISHLEKRYEEMKAMCEVLKARAYIRLQRQNHKDIPIDLNYEIAERMKNGVTNYKGIVETVVGKMKVYNKAWIVDVDVKEKSHMDDVIFCIEGCQPYNTGTKLIEVIPTKSGYHLITCPFNVEEFQQHGFKEDVLKREPTLLYLPNSLDEEL